MAVDGLASGGRIRWVKGRLQPLYVGRRKVATVAAAVLAVLLGYHVVFGANGLIVYQQKRHDARSLEQQMQVLGRENDLLQGHVQRLKDDPDAIEHQAREELHFTRPGEVIYALPGAPGEDSAHAVSPAR